MGLRRAELDDLRAAALLHHLGHLCLDAPEVRDEPIEPFEVADKGAEILRQTDLACAGDLLATDAVTVGGQILRLASAYDDLREEHDASTTRSTRSSAGPGFLYDRRVFDAFERVVSTDARRLTLPEVDLVGRGEVDRRVPRRGHAGAAGASRSTRAPRCPTASTMSPIEIAASTGSPNTIWSERNTATSESRVGRCFTVVSRGRPSATLYGMPEVERDHDRVERDAEPDQLDAAGAEVRRAEPEQRDVRDEQDRDADVVVARRRQVDHLEQDLEREPDDEQPRAPEPHLGEAGDAAVRDGDDDDRDDDRDHVREHAGTVAGRPHASRSRLLAESGRRDPGNRRRNAALVGSAA